VLISGSSNNTIGGSVTAARNVISGNATAGVTVTGGSSNNIKGNYIGLAADGQSPLANAGNGIAFSNNTSGNNVGGTTQADANVISANGLAGVWLTHPALPATPFGNLIGTDATGTLDRGNANEGSVLMAARAYWHRERRCRRRKRHFGNGTNGIAIIEMGPQPRRSGQQGRYEQRRHSRTPNSQNGILVWAAVNTPSAIPTRLQKRYLR
jgi:hypothetical protein